MKSVFSKIISLVICISVILSCTSCNLWRVVPKGYTGGFNDNPRYHKNYEFKWLETYDELMDAVTTLYKNNNSIVSEDSLSLVPIFKCEEYGLDVKFCIKFSKFGVSEQKRGQDYFDRKIGRIDIACYVFFEDVSIEELVYSKTKDYKHIKAVQYSIEGEFDDPSGAEDIRIYRAAPDEAKEGEYVVYYHGKEQLLIQRVKIDEIPEDVIEILEKTLTVIE